MAVYDGKRKIVPRGRSEQLRQNVHALVDAEDAAVEADVVVLGVTPFHIGVKAVVGGAALVLVLQTLLGGLLPLTVDLDDALGTELHIPWMKTFRQSALSCRM